MYCYALLCVHSSFSIILKRKGKLGALLLLSYRCIITINVLLSLFIDLTVSRRSFFCGSLLLAMMNMFAFVMLYCLVLAAWLEMADILTLVCVVVSYVCVTFPYVP